MSKGREMLGATGTAGRPSARSASECAVETNEPLVVGRFYMVPCIEYTWHRRRDWWPVIGPRHKDKAFLNFDAWHYHIDGRFLTAAQRDYALTRWSFHASDCLASIIEAYPLNRRHEDPPPEAPILKRRKCWSADIGHYCHQHQPNIQKIAAHFAGQQCRASSKGWVCPHQATPLGSVSPVDGVLTCPLHGLRIDAASGMVLNAVEFHEKHSGDPE